MTCSNEMHGPDRCWRGLGADVRACVGTDDCCQSIQVCVRWRTHACRSTDRSIHTQVDSSNAPPGSCPSSFQFNQPTDRPRSSLLPSPFPFPTMASRGGAPHGTRIPMIAAAAGAAAMVLTAAAVGIALRGQQRSAWRKRRSPMASLHVHLHLRGCV